MFGPSRVAIFVDAGHLYAEGSKHLSVDGLEDGLVLSRVHVQINQGELMAKLLETANAKANGASLLRAYWYDGLIGGRFNPEQQALADSDNIKFRPGVVTAGGQQKEVDSLIVTDLIELARNNAISDAVLLSRDGDLKIGVQIAQSFGVRVHLVSVAPRFWPNSRNRSLFQESDTATELTSSDVSKILALKPGADPSSGTFDGTKLSEATDEAKATLDAIVAGFMDLLDPSNRTTIGGLQSNDRIPSKIDADLLTAGRDKFGQRLSRSELTYIRERLKTECRVAIVPSSNIPGTL